MNSLLAIFVTVIVGAGGILMPVNITPTHSEQPITVVSNIGDSLIQKELIDPLTKKENIQKDMFSRCGSGYYYIHDDSFMTQNGYYQGLLEHSVGCDEPETTAKFRVNSSETKLEVLNAKTNRYETSTTWLSNYKK